MGENRWGMGIILATSHADWKDRHKIAIDTGKNAFVFIRKHPLVKLKLAEEVYGVCQKDILHLYTVCTGLSFCLYLFLPLAFAQFSLMKSFEKDKFLMLLCPSRPIWAPWVQVSSYGPVLKFLHQSAHT